MRTAATYALAFGLAVTGAGVSALTPAPVCDGAERGMLVYGAQAFGDGDSGLVIETYRNLDTADGRIAAADGPVPELNNFNGFRVTDCRSGRSVAVHGIGAGEGEAQMTATEFLRGDVQAGRKLSLKNVERAAKALYGKDGYARVLILRSKNETCACREIYPGAWN